MATQTSRTRRQNFSWRNGVGRTTSRTTPSTPSPTAAGAAAAASEGGALAAAPNAPAAPANGSSAAAPGASAGVGLSPGLPGRPSLPPGDPSGDPPDDPFGDHDPWPFPPPRTPPVPPSPAPSATGGNKKYVDYKMDPAPSWTGDMPEKNYKEYHRNLQLWLVEAEARLPSNLIGKRIIDSIPLGSKLSSLVAHLTVPEICSDDGHRVILRIIEEAHEYLKDQGLERAFDDAIFRGTG